MHQWHPGTLDHPVVNTDVRGDHPRMVPVALAARASSTAPAMTSISERVLGTRRLKGRTMRFILAAILALSGLKLIVSWPRISQILLAAVSKHCEGGVCNSKMMILDDIPGGA